MDAVIMDGKSLRAGAVASVHNIANPVSLARQVMDKVILSRIMKLRYFWIIL